MRVRTSDAQSLSYEPGDPRTAYKYPRGDHPSPTGSCVLGLTWANILKSTLGHLPMTCQARRPPGGRRVTSPFVAGSRIAHLDAHASDQRPAEQLRAPARPPLSALDDPAAHAAHAALGVRRPARPGIRPVRRVSGLHDDHPVADPLRPRPAPDARRAAATSPLAAPNGATMAISACTTAPSTMAGAPSARPAARRRPHPVSGDRVADPSGPAPHPAPRRGPRAMRPGQRLAPAQSGSSSPAEAAPSPAEARRRPAIRIIGERRRRLGAGRSAVSRTASCDCSQAAVSQHHVDRRHRRGHGGRHAGQLSEVGKGSAARRGLRRVTDTA